VLSRGDSYDPTPLMDLQFSQTPVVTDAVEAKKYLSKPLTDNKTDQ